MPSFLLFGCRESASSSPARGRQPSMPCSACSTSGRDGARVKQGVRPCC
jgi:hypothetical protein